MLITWSLRNFNLELKPGVLGLLGPNGAGKSTLMTIATLALTLGIWSGTRKFFEALYVVLWYMGPMQRLDIFDYMGVSQAALDRGMPWIYLGVAFRCNAVRCCQELEYHYPDARFLTMIGEPAPRLRSTIHYIRVNPVGPMLDHVLWTWLAATAERNEGEYCKIEQAWFHGQDDG